MTTTLRISVRNTAEDGGTFLTPFWFGLHDRGFDIFNPGEAAGAGLEALAEDGNFAPINAEVMAFDGDAVVGAVFGNDIPPIAPGEVASTVIENFDGADNTYVSLAAMVLPSNDAFVATEDDVRLFANDGTFLGPRTFVFNGSDVYDAGTEVNTELDAAFINQMGPDTGIDENGVVALHPGFLPVGEGTILGGTTATGAVIDPVAGDFTQPGAGIATVFINEATFREGTDGNDAIRGNLTDDLVTAGDGDDRIVTRAGWDEIDAGAGDDIVVSGAGLDIVNGGAGNDNIFGGLSDDILYGGADNDVLRGGVGNDTLYGGAGDDRLGGSVGADVFMFADGSERDVVRGFNAEEDVLALNVEGVETYMDALSYARSVGNGVVFDFGEGDLLVLTRTDLADLSEENFNIL